MKARTITLKIEKRCVCEGNGIKCGADYSPSNEGEARWKLWDEKQAFGQIQVYV